MNIRMQIFSKRLCYFSSLVMQVQFTTRVILALLLLIIIFPMKLNYLEEQEIGNFRELIFKVHTETVHIDNVRMSAKWLQKLYI